MLDVGDSVYKVVKTYVPAARSSNINQQRPESFSKSAGVENLRHKASEVGRL
jgi:sulfite reductase beta subunit-like hemoprotein